MQVRYLTLLSLVALAAAPCAAQTSGRLATADRAAQRVIAEFAGERPAASEIREYTDAAQNDCRSPLVSSQVGLGMCRAAQLHLAEEALARAEASYRGKIEEFGLMSPSDTRSNWHAVHAYAQRRWRESRAAECTMVVFEFTGGSGGGIGQVECEIEMTNARAQMLRQRVEG